MSVPESVSSNVNEPLRHMVAVTVVKRVHFIGAKAKANTTPLPDAFIDYSI